MSRTPPGGTRREQIVELAARPEGVTNSDLKTILGMEEHSVPVNMQALEYQGRVLRAKVEGQRLRWFKHQEHRIAWMSVEREARSALLGAERAAKQAARDVRQAAAEAVRQAAQAVRAERAAKQAAIAGNPAPVVLTNYTAGPSKVAPSIKREPIITADTKMTIDDRVHPVARWQMQPSQPTPGFSGMGIGRYLA